MIKEMKPAAWHVGQPGRGPDFPRLPINRSLVCGAAIFTLRLRWRRERGYIEIR